MRPYNALLPVLAFATAATWAGEVLVDADFGRATEAVPAHATIQGVLPAGVTEDSAWADVDIRYVQESDRLGSDLKWVRAELGAIRKGKAQLKWPLAGLDNDGFYRLEATLGAEGGGRAVFRIVENAAPYTVLWEQNVPLGARETRSWDFQLAAHSRPASLILALEQAGDYNLYSVQLTRRAAEEIELERAAAIAAAPHNLAPNAGFALGLPTAWSIGQRLSPEHDVTFRPAPEPGPHGTIPLQIDVVRPGVKYDLFSAPFQVADPGQIHVVSFLAKGERDGTLKILCDGKEFGSGTFTATPEGKLAKIPFRVDPHARWIVLQWQGADDLEIDALNVSMGRKAKPFTLPRPAELALAADFLKADVFVEGEGEVELRYHASGETEGASLRLKVTNLYGQTVEAEPFAMDLETRIGNLTPPNPDPSRPYGSFRAEAWLVRDGEKISPVAEVVYHVVQQPAYWGRIAPESRFGNHMHLNERHLHAAKAIGMNWNRFHGGNAESGTYWSSVEPEKGVWRWHKDRLRRYRDAGFALCGVWARVPNWARSARATPEANGWLDNWWQPRDYAEFAEYVRRSATEYAGLIDAWQIWNEPWGEFWFKEWRDDLQGEKRWHPGETPEEDYVALSKAAWEAFQQTGLDMPVIGIGATFGERGKKWMTRMLALDAEQYCSALSFHAYFGGDLALGLDDNSELLRNLERRVFQPVRDDPAAADMPLWMTEGGWLQRRADTGLHHHSVPGPKDALEVVRENAVKVPLYHVILLANGVDKIFTYAINGGPGYYKPYPQGQIDWSSLVTPGGEIHPAATAYAAMAARLDRAQFQREIRLADSSVAYVFQNPDGTQFLALFGSNVNDRLPMLGDQVRDFLGNPAATDIANQLLYVGIPPGASPEQVIDIPAVPSNGQLLESGRKARPSPEISSM